MARERLALSVPGKVGAVSLAVAAVAISARLSFDLPFTSVPQTAQTLVVLACGIFLGARLGGLAMVAYLGLGALGLPVFADGEGGIDHLIGPTAGYLVGFVPAAALAGWWVAPASPDSVPSDSGRPASWWWLVLGMILAHALILAMGATWLALSVGFSRAWAGGVAPFLLGALVKSSLAALLGWQWGRYR